MLFSHPAGFTPVCKTEFIGFAKKHDAFTARSTELLGLSIESLYSHIAGMLNINDKFGVEIKRLIIADLNMAVAQTYGMMQPGASDTAAVRATFLIGPEGVLCAMVFYSMNAGQSVVESYHLLVAMQTTDENARAMPENWKLGAPVIVPTPATSEGAIASAGQGFEIVEWYFSTRIL